MSTAPVRRTSSRRRHCPSARPPGPREEDAPPHKVLLFPSVPPKSLAKTAWSVLGDRERDRSPLTLRSDLWLRPSGAVGGIWRFWSHSSCEVTCVPEQPEVERGEAREARLLRREEAIARSAAERRTGTGRERVGAHLVERKHARLSLAVVGEPEQERVGRREEDKLLPAQPADGGPAVQVDLVSSLVFSLPLSCALYSLYAL